MRKNEDHITLDLVVKLCKTLADKKIDYCHWKSNAFLERSASGENDLDLLINRTHSQLLQEILYSLGFKETLQYKNKRLPGVCDYYGWDQKTGRIVHVHLHFQLIMGNDLSKNYRLPIEKIYLDSSIPGNLFRIPASEFELVVLVIRMILKHSTWDSILMRHGNLSQSERHELSDLITEETLQKVDNVLEIFPGLSRNLFTRCLQSLQPGCPYWTRVRTGKEILNVMRSFTRYPYWKDIVLKFSRRIGQSILNRKFMHLPKNRFACGGLLISIVGGDGAGKTTVVDGLYQWLSENFDVIKLHFGKPTWSWTTFTIHGILKIGTLLGFYPFEGDVYEESIQKHGYPWFIRSVCTARDRYLTYIKARRFSSNGGLILCDRYSFINFMKMDGPQCESAIMNSKKTNKFLKFLSNKEKYYYSQIKLPDLLIVLKVDPEIAVQRKLDETRISVWARSSEVWDLDWKKISAYEINAVRSKDEVLSQVKALVWEHI